MKTMIGIFKGKGATNNKFLLETLYENGPLSAWDLTKTVRKENRMSLHSVFNKSLRLLEKKGYVQRAERKWLLQFKGIIAVLIIQTQPKPWNEKWTEIISQYIKRNSPFSNSRKITIEEDGKEIADLTKFVKSVPITLKRFESWVALANHVKKLMEKGFINLDVIKNKSLVLLIVTELSNGSLSTALGE